MDIANLKRITKFARRNGIKTLKFEGFEIEFNDNEIRPTPKRIKGSEEDIPVSEPQEITLDQINDYIYGNIQEVQ